MSRYRKTFREAMKKSEVELNEVELFATKIKRQTNSKHQKDLAIQN